MFKNKLYLHYKQISKIVFTKHILKFHDHSQVSL